MKHEETGGRTSAGTELELVLKLSQLSRDVSLGDIAGVDLNGTFDGTPEELGSAEKAEGVE